MPNVFSNAINDIFAVQDFLETLQIANDDSNSSSSGIAVVSYEGSTDEQYTEFGADSGKAIRITCKCCDWTPRRSDKVLFRNQTWKVADFTTDSHNLTHIVSLKSVESK